MEEIIFTAEKIRSPMVGGMFYPEDNAEVQAKISGFGLKKGTGGRAGAIIAPHGAWGISGKIAGDAFSAAGGRFSPGGGTGVSRIVALGPVHDKNESGVFLSDSDYFETPLGNIPVDRRMSDEILSGNSLFELNDIPHLREHSLEVLLPFIKYCFPGASIVPVLMAGSQPLMIAALAGALRRVFESLMGDTLLVVSCNLSMNNDADRARTQAEECVRLLLEKNAAQFSAGLQNGQLNPCGGALAAVLLESGLVEDREAALVSGSLIHAAGEENKTVYYGAISYE
jgi:AmmeMemoRadiSam system protein B